MWTLYCLKKGSAGGWCDRDKLGSGLFTIELADPLKNPPALSLSERLDAFENLLQLGTSTNGTHVPILEVHTIFNMPILFYGGRTISMFLVEFGILVRVVIGIFDALPVELRW